MATIFEGTLNTVDITTDGEGVSVNAIDTVELRNKTFAFGASATRESIFSYKIDSEGKIEFNGSVADTASVSLTDVSDVATARIGNKAFVFAVSPTEDGVSSFRVKNNGLLKPVDNVTDTAALELDGATRLETVTVGNRDFLIVSSGADDGVQVFRIARNGKLQARDSQDDSNDSRFGLDNALAVTSAEVNGNTFVFVSGYYDDAVTVFQLDRNGELTYTYSVFDNTGLHLDAGLDLETAVVNGRTYLFASDYYDGISVFEVQEDGALANVNNVDDSVIPELNGLRDFDILEFGSKSYLATTNYYTPDSVSLLEIGNGGTLTLTDASAGNFAGVAVANVDGSPFLLAAENSYYGSVHSIAVGGQADQLNGTRVADEIFGFAANDVLRGRGGGDLLKGGGGSDTLIGATGDDTADGGAGNDVVRGNAGDDVLIGDLGNDRLFGGGGDDSASGGRGNDTIAGAGGNDTADGGIGADVVRGNAGDDDLTGGGGHDRLFGGGGDDIVNGGRGNDYLSTGSGQDLVVIERNGGKDFLADFADGFDMVDFSDFGFANLVALRNIAENVDAGLLIRFGGPHELLIEGLALSDFNNADVIL